MDIVQQVIKDLEASMRPRHKAAEYPLWLRRNVRRAEVASMRPRHKAAEYARMADSIAPSIVPRFNEAAA